MKNNKMRLLGVGLTLVVGTGALFVNANENENIYNNTAAIYDSVESGWTKVGSGWRYKDEAGNLVHGLYDVDGYTYIFDEDCKRLSGDVSYEGVKYITDDSGRILKNQLIELDGESYYLNNDGLKVVNDFVSIDGKKAFFGEDGKRVFANFVKADDGSHYINEDGDEAIGFFDVDGKTFYADDSGVLAYNKEVKVNDKDYLVDENGFVVKNQTIGDFFYNESGVKERVVKAEEVKEVASNESLSVDKKTETVKKEVKVDEAKNNVNNNNVVKTEQKKEVKKEHSFEGNQGDGGRLFIPDVNLSVALYNIPSNASDSYAQQITDAEDAATVLVWDQRPGTVIADHNYQGFEKIKNAKVGTRMYIRQGDTVYEYECDWIDYNGVNNGSGVYTSGGYLIWDLDGITLQTCNEHWTSDTLVHFNRVN